MTTDEKIEDLRVRVAVAEHSLGAIQTQLGRVEAEILDHRRASQAAHNETTAAIRAATDTTFRIDGSAIKILGAILAAALASLIGGGVIAAKSEATASAPTHSGVSVPSSAP